MIADLLLPIIEQQNPDKLSSLDFYMKLLDSRLSSKLPSDDRILGTSLNPKLLQFLQSLSIKKDGNQGGFLSLDKIAKPAKRIVVDQTPPMESKPPKFMGEVQKSLVSKYYTSNTTLDTILKDLPYTLQGLDTPLITLTNTINFNFKQSAPVKDLLKHIVICGYYYKHLQYLKNQGLLWQALYAFINTELQQYQQLILKISSLSNPTLLIIKTLTEDWRLKLKWMVEITNSDDLLSKLQMFTKHGNELLKSISDNCLASVKRVLDNMVTKFIANQHQDPYNEFFIQNNFIIDSKRPSFVTERMANEILQISKNSSFTQQFYNLTTINAGTISKLYNDSSRDVVRKLSSKGLDVHLLNLSKYLLLMDGEFVKSLHEQSTLNEYELSRIVQDLSCEQLDITLDSNRICLKYDLDPLFNSVISEPQLHEYESLFLKLFDLYKENHTLLQSWRSFTSNIINSRQEI